MSNIFKKLFVLSNFYGPDNLNSEGNFYLAWSAINENQNLDIFVQNVSQEHIQVYKLVIQSKIGL